MLALPYYDIDLKNPLVLDSICLVWKNFEQAGWAY